MGYKYFNFDNAQVSHLLLDITPLGQDATVNVMLDSPWEKKGGKPIGSFTLSKDMESARNDIDVLLSGMKGVKGKHGIYLVVDSPVKSTPLFDLYELQFK